MCNLSVFVSGTVLLVKQGWPQASGAAGALEGSYDLAMDAGSEGRQYQASAAAFSKYDPMYSTHSHTNTDPICMHTDIHTRFLRTHRCMYTHVAHAGMARVHSMLDWVFELLGNGLGKGLE